MKKTPDGVTTLGLVRTQTTRTRGLGGWEAPGIFQFEPGNFLRLYQTAHSESTVDKRDNSTDPTKRSVAKIVSAATETGRHWASFLCGLGRAADLCLPAAGMTAVKPLWPRLSRRRSSHIRSCGLQDQRELDVV
jgi:hypothetical protein